MSHVLSQPHPLHINVVMHYLGSDRFVAVSVAVLLHLIVLAMLLAGWQENKPVPPTVNTIKVQIMMQAPTIEPVVSAPVPEPQVVEMPKPETPTPKVIKEADFAKKRVDEPVIKPQEPEHEKVSEIDTPQTVDVPTINPVESTNQTTQKSESKTSADASAAKASAENQAFDSSQYFPVQKNAPAYPQRALDKNVQGVCTVRYTVNAEGRVENPEALGDCHAFFIKPSLEATKSFRYTPRVVDGKAVKVPNVKNTFQYRIE